MTELQTGLLAGFVFLAIVWGCAFIARSNIFPDINEGKVPRPEQEPKILL